MKEEALKAHEAVVKGADEALYDAGFADGTASVQVPVEGGQYTEQQREEYAQAKVAEALAAQPADTTPHSVEEMEALKSEVQAAKDLAAQWQSDDEADKSKIASLTGKFEKIEAILHSSDSAPEQTM